MDNLSPVTNIDQNELPDGFTKASMDASSQKKQQVAEQQQAVLEQALTPEALARLGRIKLVKPAKVQALEKSIVHMAMSGKLPGRINEGKLIEMLERGAARQDAPAGIKIQRKKCALDSDDEDDDDEDFM